MKIIVLGSKGMLGRYVSRYLSKKFNVIQINRDVLDASKQNDETIERFLINNNIKKNDVIINCIGTIKPKVDELGDLNAILVNSVFPRLLANICEKNGCKLIHPTTDCVYNGIKGNYDENSVYDANDIYGMSKAIGEPKNCTVIRTSIIGEEIDQKRSLVEWVKSNNGEKIFGFTNHFWNGMTCLQFAKICEKIISENLFWNGIKHLYSNVVSKKELLEILIETYDLNTIVHPRETDVACDRTISTVYSDNISSFNIPTLKEQIIEMKNFYNELI